MAFQKDWKRKIMLIVQMVLIFVLFWMVNLVVAQKLSRNLILITLGIFIVVVFIKFQYTQKHYITVPLVLTKGLKYTLQFFPIVAIPLFFYLPTRSGINAMAAGTVFALDTLLKDKANIYLTKEEYEAKMKNVKKVKKTRR